MNRSQLHPTREQLAAYSRGALTEANDREIEHHLQDCDACCDTLNSLPEDTFVAMMRSESAAGTGPDQDRLGSVTSQLPPTPLADHPRYRVIELVGEGGMGAVYRAEHRMMRRDVAIKLINPQLIDRPDVLDRFHREVQAAARLSHPNIVASYDAEQAGDQHFLVMEFVAGTDLAEIVKQGGPLRAVEACDYVRQAAQGLVHAYEQGMVHRDIKPHNLMLTGQSGPDQVVKILDFGLATLLDETQDDPSADDDHSWSACGGQLTAAGSMMGTPDFVSPEQADDPRLADTRSDIYSLGATLYYLLAGRPPFAEGTIREKLAAQRESDPQPIDHLRPDVPAELVAVLGRMMAKKPAERFATPQDVVAALAPFVNAEKTPGSAQPRRARSITVRSPLARAVIVATVFAGLVLLGSWVYVATDRGTLQIRTNSHDVHVVVRQDGKIVEIVDQASSVPLVRLRSGKYEVALANERDRLQLSQDSFELRRGNKVIIEVRVKTPRRDGPNPEFVPPPVLVRQFRPSDRTIARDAVTPDSGGWKIEADGPRTVRLFEVEVGNIDNCTLLYQARLKTEDLGEGQAYLEMLCHLPVLGDSFSRFGQLNPLTGDTDWVFCETPMFVQPGQRPDVIRLNVVINGRGTVWIKDVVLRTAPLPPADFFQRTTPGTDLLEKLER